MKKCKTCGAVIAEYQSECDKCIEKYNQQFRKWFFGIVGCLFVIGLLYAIGTSGSGSGSAGMCEYSGCTSKASRGSFCDYHENYLSDVHAAQEALDDYQD